MADQIRTQSAALAFMPLTAGRHAITIQMMRDIVYSLFSKAYFSTAVTLPSLADSAVPTPAALSVALYYSTTQSGLCFKDSAGVVHEITST
jgi:hypothetical protein